jgi:hypothetical protein
MREDWIHCWRCDGNGDDGIGEEGGCITCDGVGSFLRRTEETEDRQRRMSEIGMKYGPSSPVAKVGRLGYSWKGWIADGRPTSPRGARK